MTKHTIELVWHSCTDCLPEENYNRLYVTDGIDVYEAEWERTPNGYQCFGESPPWPDALEIEPGINSDGWWWADLIQTTQGFAPIQKEGKEYW